MSNYVYGPLSTEETGANEEILRKVQARIKAVQAATAAEIAGKEGTANHGPLFHGAAAPAPAIAGSTASKTAALTKALQTEATKEGPLGSALGDVGSAGKAVLNAPGEFLTGAGSDAAGAVVSGVFGDIKEAVGADFVKGLLYVVLAGGGAMLIITGISRSTGLRPAQGAKKVAGIAATGAVLA
jgi:hypothetical protein